MSWHDRLFIFLAALTVTGCSPPREALVVTSPDPAVKIPAMKKAAREGDLTKVRQLVADLNNDDPAVRMYAIGALSRLTGQTYGYHYYDDEVQRQPAVQRWQQWLDGQAAEEPGRQTGRGNAPVAGGQNGG